MTNDENSNDDIASQWAKTQEARRAENPRFDGNIREQWEARQAEIAKSGNYISAEPQTVDLQALSDFFNFRPAPDQASFWELCQETGITFDEAMQTFIEKDQWRADRQSSVEKAEESDFNASAVIDSQSLSPYYAQILSDAQPHVTPEFYEILKQTFIDAEARARSLEAMPTFKHASGADMLRIGVKFDAKEGLWVNDRDNSASDNNPVQEGWEYALKKLSEAEREAKAKETPDEYGNKPSDYTNTGSSADSYHAQSIGWKHPDFD